MIQTIGAVVSIAAMVLACVLFGIWHLNPKNIEQKLEQKPEDAESAPVGETAKKRDAKKSVQNKD